jgi:hypothetical protein
VHQLFIYFNKSYGSLRREIFYSILTESGIYMELVMLIKMNLNEIYRRIWVEKYFSGGFLSRIVWKKDMF